MLFWRDYNFQELKKVMDEDGYKVIKSKQEYDNINEDESENYDTPKTYEEIKNKKISETIFTIDTESTSYFLDKDGRIFNFDYTKNTEYYEDIIKQGLCYIWMLGINKTVLYGREIEELGECLEEIHKIQPEVKIIVYIHNLSFDYQFLLNAFGTVDFNIFARKLHKIMKAEYQDWLEFRCSYFLTNMSLDNFCKSYKLPVQKKVGDLDYNKLRTPLTKLTDKELGYCEYDILCLYEVILYHKKRYKSIYNIPLTQTGKIRKQVNHLFFKNHEWHKKIAGMKYKNYEQFKLLARVYQGGYTHSNILNTNKLLKNVQSWDINSSYPFEICTKKYPMTEFRKGTKPFTEIKRDKEAFIVHFIAYNVKAETSNNILSESKAVNYGDIYTDSEGNNHKIEYIVDNGRIKQAGYIEYIITDVDFDLFNKFYDYEDIEIKEYWIANKDFLPVELIKYVLGLYKDKTQLKGVAGAEVFYIEKKQFLNGIYGMFVTKLIADCVFYDVTGGWSKRNLDDDIGELMVQKQKDKKENLNFAWGPWVSAYARQHLLRVTLKLNDSDNYCDTDSHKIRTDKLSEEEIKKIFAEDREQVLKDIEAVIKHYPELKLEDFKPKDSKGRERLLGEYDFEGTYKQFKTLGAKRYAYSYYESKEDYIENYRRPKLNKIKAKLNKVGFKKGEYIVPVKEKKVAKNLNLNTYINITLAGVNKKSGSKSIDNLDDFKNGRFFDYKEAGKTIAYYNTNQQEVTFPDGYVAKQKYGICLMPTTYILDMHDYIDLLNKLEENVFIQGVGIL